MNLNIKACSQIHSPDWGGGDKVRYDNPYVGVNYIPHLGTQNLATAVGLKILPAPVMKLFQVLYCTLTICEFIEHSADNTI
jgi:hypothetical protein